MELKEILQKLPAKPGVYIFKDNKGYILYIGKANNLRARVRSYFRESASLSQRIRSMVSVVADIDYLITKNEVEALILESNLVKKHKPKFNIILRDDKHYPYLRLAADEMFPYLSIVRRVKKDKGIYFGPYASAKSLRKTLKLIHRIFQLRQSRDQLDGAPKRRPCLNYQMGRCLAPCAGYVKKADYDKIIKDVILFLKGRNDELLNNLKSKMDESSENLKFEEAGRVRDQISAIERTMERQNIISTALEDEDVIAIYRDGGKANVQLLFIRGGKIIGDKNLLIPLPPPLLKGDRGDFIDDTEIFSSFVRQYYSGDVFIPEEIILEKEIEEVETVKEWLSEKRGGRVDIVVPHRGRKMELVQMAKENAAISIKATLDSADLRMAALRDLKDRLGLNKLPLRIEAFDISTIMGTSAVGSMVVFIDGEPSKNDYKRFRIKTVTGMDDYGMMREILMRRYSTKTVTIHQSPFTSILPDLIIVDGGKGQLSTLVNVLKELSITNIDTIGIAKGEDRNNPETDTIYLPNRAKGLILPSDSSGRHLIQRIRDEAHRFAIKYHRELRGKEGITSELDEIPGIGTKRKRTLLKHFGSLKKIKEASIEELSNVLHISKKSAIELHERLL
jgi:excinuclease ABC subunit C